jgi:hypothetical protein
VESNLDKMEEEKRPYEQGGGVTAKGGERGQQREEENMGIDGGRS